MSITDLDNPELIVHAFDYAAIGKALVTTNGKLIKVNQSMCDCFGYKEKELLNLSYNDITHPEDVHIDQPQIEQLLAGKINSYQIEKRFVHKTGRDIIALLSVSLVRDDDGEPLFFVKQIQDITNRRIAELQFIEGEKRYQRIVEESPDGVIILQDGKILFINEAGVHLLGGNLKNDVIGKPIYDFFQETERNRIKALKNNINQEGSIGPIEEQFIRKDDTVIDVEIKTIPTVFHGKNAIHAIVRDITERKMAQEHFINSEKLTVAGQLAAGIAHEVRNPLTSIKGFLQILENELTEKKMYFDVISAEINRIETILSELLASAKPQKVNFDENDISTILHQVITLINTQAKMKGIEIVEKIPTDLPKVYCDKNQLKQVCINILKNSIEALSNGGNIYIEVIRTDSIRIRIIDDGPGIPKNILGKIWDPFFTTKKAGTGLGLMICKQIIEQHDGELQIESSEKGTSVEIILPIDRNEENPQD